MTIPPEISAHAAVALGLVAGSFAKYGLVLEEGGSIARRQVAGHCMMLALLGLLAEAACGVVPLPPTAHAIAGAGAALLAGKLVRRFRKWAEGQAEQKLGDAGVTP